MNRTRSRRRTAAWKWSSTITCAASAESHSCSATCQLMWVLTRQLHGASGPGWLDSRSTTGIHWLHAHAACLLSRAYTEPEHGSCSQLHGKLLS